MDKNDGIPNGEIHTNLCFSAALSYFSEASIYGIILIYGMGKQSDYDSIYGVLDAHKSDSLTFDCGTGIIFITL